MKKLITAVTTVLALVLATPALAVSQGGLNVVDNKVAGVYRSIVGNDGLALFKRSGKRLFVIQGENAGYYDIDQVLFNMAGTEQVVHMLDGSGELVTFELNHNQAIMTLADGDAIYMQRVRALTRHDLAKFEGYEVVEEKSESKQASGPSFDCAKAGNQVEFLICGSSALSSMDLAMATGYKTLLSYAGDEEGKAYIRNQQREWIGKRNTCRNADCLMQSYNERLLFIGDMIEYLNNN
jgi:uncharacterized protein YecT (DUF1311 family)